MRFVIDCMEGIGDNIYARGVLRELAREHDVYVRSVLPWLFADLGVKLIRPASATYRTQLKASADALNFPFVVEPTTGVDRRVNLLYTAKDLAQGSILGALEYKLGVGAGAFQDLWLDLPATLTKHGLTLPSRKIAVIRPVTLRKEWLCSSRAPLANYIGWAAKVLKTAGYYVISLADCDGEHEWIDGDEPPADLKLHAGELSIQQVLSLFQEAHLVVGGSGFIIPAALAAGADLFIIFGGRGGYDNPHKVLDPRLDLRRTGWALPRNFCRCISMEHDCDKNIPDLDSQLFKYLARTS